MRRGSKSLRQSSVVAVGNNLITKATTFWKSGKTAKIITVVTLSVVLCCSCIALTQIASAPRGNTPATTTPILSELGTQTFTSTTAPASIIPLTPTASFIPSLAPFVTAAEIFSSPLPSGNPLRVHFIDVGQGDSELIQTPNGQTLLIDGGDTDTGIVQYLQSIGVQRIDLMIATHPHSDHIGGLVQVLQAFSVAKVVTNGQLDTTTIYEHFLDAITASKAAYIDIKRGDMLSLDGIDFHCLSPVATTNPDLNENSIVLQFTYGQTKFLMMGDAGGDTESALLAANLLAKVNILKVGHHGSSTGSTPAFLNVIKPDVAIYSAGINNIYGLPDQQTISALRAAGATVYGTDQNGTIVITVNQNGYTTITSKSNASVTTVLSPTEMITQAFTLTQTPILAFTPTLALTPTWTPTVPAPGQFEIYPVSPVSRNQNATLTAKTSPNTPCSITVHTKSGTSSAQGLNPKNADANGMVSWTWRIGPNTTLGTWRIDVTCNGVTKSTTYTVQ